MMSGLSYKIMDSYQSDNIIINIIFAVVISSLITNIMNYDFIEKLFQLKDKISCLKNKVNEIEFTRHFDHRRSPITSFNYKAVMHYISSHKNKSIKKLIEHFKKEYCYDTDKWENENFYKVNQYQFKITDDIDGSIDITKLSEKNSNGDEIKTNKETFKISSKKLSLQELQDFVKKCSAQYDEYLKDKLDTTKNIIICSWDDRDKNFKIECREWKTTSSFDNKFFEGKKRIVDSINKFEKGEDFYMKKGLEYQFGIMLSGEPGCGKTTFIKCVSKLTSRIIIIVKWTSSSDLEKLSKIILGSRIGDYSIPHSKRLWIFEDIDAMGDIVKDRDLVEKEKKDKDKMMLKLMKQMDSPQEKVKKPRPNKINTKINENENYEKVELPSYTSAHNNLSTYLNMIQGIEESHGRMMIITTNKRHTIDKAVLRPGRIDADIIMKKASNQIILEILNYYWETNKKNNSIPKKLSYNFTHAEIIGKCRKSKSFDDTIKNLLI